MSRPPVQILLHPRWPWGVVGSLDPGVGGGLELTVRASAGAGVTWRSPGSQGGAGEQALASEEWNRHVQASRPFYLIHKTSLWGVNGRDDWSRFTDEKIEVRRGGSFPGGHPGRKDKRGSAWIPASMGSAGRRWGLKSLLVAKQIQETRGHLRRRRQAPVSLFSASPPFASPSIALPPARRPPGSTGQACSIPGREAQGPGRTAPNCSASP